MAIPPENEDEKNIREVAIRVEVSPGDALVDIQSAMMDAIGTILSNEAIVFPVHVAALSRNGAGYIIRYTLPDDDDDPDMKVTILAGHEEAEGMMLPIHSLIMDSDGYTARVIVTPRKIAS
jgi:hypothetical protein